MRMGRSDSNMTRYEDNEEKQALILPMNLYTHLPLAMNEEYRLRAVLSSRSQPNKFIIGRREYAHSKILHWAADIYALDDSEPLRTAKNLSISHKCLNLNAGANSCLHNPFVSPPKRRHCRTQSVNPINHLSPSLLH